MRTIAEQDLLMKLKADHKTVKDLLKQLEDTSERATKKRNILFDKLKNEIQLHTKVEEKLLYPRMKQEKITTSLVLESYEEHHLVDHIITEIESTDFSDPVWKAKLTVLKENLLHHIKEEETDLFPKVKKVLDKNLLLNLGKEMDVVKKMNQ